MDPFGADSFFSSVEAISSTFVGLPSFSDQNAPSMMWHPMSPSAPVPKSHQPRHAKG